MNYIYLFIAMTFSAMITIGGRLYNKKTKGVKKRLFTRNSVPRSCRRGSYVDYNYFFDRLSRKDSHTSVVGSCSRRGGACSSEYLICGRGLTPCAV